MKYLFLLFICLVNITTSYSLNANLNAESELKKKLSETKTLSGNFTQTTQDASGNILLTSEGQFKLSPGLFFWETQQPYQQKIIVRNGEVVLLDSELLQATVRQLNDSADQLPVLLLAGSGADNKNAMKILAGFDISENKNQYLLTSKKQNELVSSIVIRFDEDSQAVAQIKFTNALEQTTIINFSQLRANKTIESKIFYQAIPDDYDVVDS